MHSMRYKKILLGLLVAAWLQPVLALPAEVVRTADDSVTISWDAAAGPVDVFQYFGHNNTARQLISTRDADGVHQQSTSTDRPYFILKTIDGKEYEVAERLLPLAGGNNFRDLGGYETLEGKQVKWGALYRSGAMDGLTDEDYRYLSQLGIAVVCDLRSTEERHGAPTRWQAEPAPQRLERDYELEMTEMFTVLSQPGVEVPRVMEAFAGFYRDVPFQFAAQYREMFAALLAGKAPLAFNCSAGKDRTGVGGALLLMALGVSREDVIADYLLSNKYYRPPVSQTGDDATSRMLASLPPEVIGVLMGVDRLYIEAALDAVESRHGSMEAYMEAELGLDTQAMTQLRALYTR
jgi:protein-tyrosine phosphatase